MLTRKRWTPPNIPPSLPAELQEYIRNQNKSISDYLLSLESPDSLTINEAEITATNGIIFPTSTVDDYEEDVSFTPTITAGTGAFTTVSATGLYSRVGNIYTYRIVVTITTNGTAASHVKFTTPFTASGIDPIAGFETNVVGIGLSGYLNGTNGLIYTTTGAYPGGDGRVLIVRGVCVV